MSMDALIKQFKKWQDIDHSGDAYLDSDSRPVFKPKYQVKSSNKVWVKVCVSEFEALQRDRTIEQKEIIVHEDEIPLPETYFQPDEPETKEIVKATFVF